MIKLNHNKAQNRQTFAVWLLDAPFVNIECCRPIADKNQIGTLLAQMPIALLS
jgi:hypothetical protein